MAPKTIKEKFDAKRASSPAAKRREKKLAEALAKRPVMKAIPTRFPTLDPHAKKDKSLIPQNKVPRSVYDYFPADRGLGARDEESSLGEEWENRTTD